ncbi:MAG: alpha/beta fold hydrolase [Woeseiaceae bacterium]|nr:alpha/beta fold hydrolase [Woeseiaceae bacterium]
MTDHATDTTVVEARDGHQIHARLFRPHADPKGVIQVLHGLGEHSGRYARFAAAAMSREFAVVVHDHRGHGGHTEPAGYFADSGGWQQLIEDALSVHEYAREQYANVPITLLGHSMGSFLAQSFAMVYGDRLQALLLSASTWSNRVEVLAGNLVARIECWRLGSKRESALLDKLGFGGFNGPFKPPRTEFDWLSRDPEEVDAYIADPLCGGPFTAGLWRDLTGALVNITSDDALLRIPSDLPIMITGGASDPVGGERKLGKLALHYAQTHHGRLKVKIYPGGRHEMLNETNRDEVTADWLDWIEAHTRA